MSEGSELASRRAWTVAVMLWVTVVSVTAFEIAPASVLPLVAADLGVGRTGVSWLVSVLLLGMAVCSMPAGVILDRYDDRRVIGLTAAGFCLCTVATTGAALDGDYRALVAVRFVAGALVVVLWTASVNVVGATFPSRRQGTGIGFLATSVPVGFAAAHVVEPRLAAAVGWEQSFVAFGLVTGVATGAFWRYTRADAIRTELSTPTRAELLVVLRNPWVWTVGGLAFAAFSLNLFFNNWLPTYLADRYGLTLAQGGAFAALFPAVGAVARLVSGGLSDRLLDGRRNPIVLGSFLVVVPVVVALPRVRTVALVVVALVVAGFVTQMGLVLLLPYARELVADNVAGTALSVLNLVGFVGAFSAPVLTSLLIDRTGTYAAAFAYATALAVLGLVLAFVTPEVS